MADDEEQPQYTVYRSRPRAPWRKDDGGIAVIRVDARFTTGASR